METDKGNHPKLIEIYNNTGADIDLFTKNLKIYYASNANAEGGSPVITIDSGTFLTGQVIVVGPYGWAD